MLREILKITCIIILIGLLAIVAPGYLFSLQVHMPFVHSVCLWIISAFAIYMIFNSLRFIKYGRDRKVKLFKLKIFGKYAYLTLNLAAIFLAIITVVLFYNNIPILYGVVKLAFYCLKTLVPMIATELLIIYASINLYK